MKKIGILFLFLFSFLVFAPPVFAYKTIDAAKTTLGAAVEPTGLSTADIQTTTGTLIKGALTLVGTVFFALMVYGGFTWMTARGEEDKITKAKETIVAAAIGIAIILAAYAITNFITTKLISSNPAAQTPGKRPDPLPPPDAYCDLHPEDRICQPVPVPPDNPVCDLHPENPGC